MTGLALCVMCAAEEPAPILCVTCTLRARRDLDTIGKARRDLDPTPRRGRGGRASGKPGSRPPADLTVLAMTDPRSHTLIDWDTGEHDADDVACIDAELLTEARWCIEERHLAAPLRDTFDAIRIINVSFDWATRSERADEFAAVLASCAVGLKRALRDGREPAVGRCLAVDRAGKPCNGPVRLDWPHPVHHDDPEAPYAPSGASCARCGACVDVPMLLDVFKAFPSEFPVARDWVSATLGVNPASLRKWVSRGRVRAYGDGTVNLADVLAKVRA